MARQRQAETAPQESRGNPFFGQLDRQDGLFASFQAEAIEDGVDSRQQMSRLGLLFGTRQHDAMQVEEHLVVRIGLFQAGNDLEDRLGEVRIPKIVEIFLDNPWRALVCLDGTLKQSL